MSANHESVLYVVASVYTGTGTWVFRTRAAANSFKDKKNASKAALRRNIGAVYFVSRAKWGPDA